MIVVVIAEKKYSQALSLLPQSSQLADGIELRLDMFEEINFVAIQQLMVSIALPCILTLRPQREGGCYHGTEQTRLALLLRLAELAPAYMDIEHFVPNNFLLQLQRQYPHIQIIRSYHNFQQIVHLH